MPRVTKKQVKEVLNNDGYIKYDKLERKPYLVDKDDNVLGTINFNTWCQTITINYYSDAVYEYHRKEE